MFFVNPILPYLGYLCLTELAGSVVDRAREPPIHQITHMMSSTLFSDFLFVRLFWPSLRPSHMYMLIFLLVFNLYLQTCTVQPTYKAIN